MHPSRELPSVAATEPPRSGILELWEKPLVKLVVIIVGALLLVAVWPLALLGAVPGGLYLAVRMMRSKRTTSATPTTDADGGQRVKVTEVTPPPPRAMPGAS
jgi:hypothetical protein